MMDKFVYKNMSIHDYHSDDNSYSRSQLMDYKKSAYNFWSKHISKKKEPKKVTKAMKIGSALHTIILEPHLFDQEFAVKPSRVLLKEQGREKYDDYVSKIKLIEETKKMIITEEDFDLLNNMKKAIENHSHAKDMIIGGIYEQSYFWKDRHTDLIVKCRPDIKQSNFVVDLKTCVDASPYAFQREIIDHGYHIQAAIILDGIKICEQENISNYYCIAIEKKYPFCIGIYKLDELMLENGHDTYKSLLSKLYSSLKKNEWPDYEPQEISLPAYAA